MSRFLVLAVTLASSTAIAAPAVIDLTSNQQYPGEPSVAGGPKGWAIAWPNQATDAGERTTIAAIVDDAGKVTSVKAPLALPGYPRVAWNGTDFTLVVCNGWGGKNSITWGNLALDGTFTQQGTKKLDKGDNINCSRAEASADGTVSLVVASDEEIIDENDNPTGRKCWAKRVDIKAGKATLGKSIKLCTTLAVGPAWIAGHDQKSKIVIVDKKTRPVPETMSEGVGGMVLDGRFANLAAGPKLLVSESPFKMAWAVWNLDKSIAKDANKLVAIAKDRFVVLNQTSKGLGAWVFSGGGGASKLLWSGTLGTNGSFGDCAMGAKDLLCAWTGTGKTDVHAAKVTIP